jgi:hypothetical protein
MNKIRIAHGGHVFFAKSRPNVDFVVKDLTNFLSVKIASNWPSSFRGYDN